MAGYIGSKSSVTLVDGYTEAEADAEFVNDPNEVITVDGSNVGIGTSSPAVQNNGAGIVLDLANTGSANTTADNTELVVRSSSRYAALSFITPTDKAATINFGDTDDANIGIVQYNHADNAMSFSTSAAERMKIDASGRVTTPNQPFFSAAYNLSGTGFVTSYNNIMLNNGGFTITNGKIYVPVAGYYYINAYGIATDQFDTRVVANTTGTSPFLFDFRQSTWASGTHHGCGNGRVVYLASGSYVGINRLSGTQYVGAGTSNPHNLISIMLMG